ncbi:MAG: glycoside hydrolase family 5 protein [Oscillospiraceae bacterium]|nr:glycoside hydrolase family 5 protein [Oscillospiraceae bacterium]
MVKSNIGFIRTDGTGFTDGNGNEYIIKGMGFWGGNAPTAPDSFHESDFANMAGIGFNSVRLYLGANFFEDTSTKPVSYKDATWTWLNERIEWARKYNMTLVLNFHFTPAAKSISDRALFTDKERQDRLVALWRAVAERCANEPVIAAYDIVNEPNSRVINGDTKPYGATFKVWEDLANRVVAAIREVDMNHVIIIERLWLSGCPNPADNASPNDQHDKWQNVNGKYNFPDITDPANNYAYTYHCYEPGRYVHQTAGDCNDGTDRVYPADMIAKHDGNWKMNKEFLEHVYTIPLDYIKGKNVPAYIGELGIHIGNFGENSAGINKGGRQWILDVMEILDKYKLSFNFHPYYEYEIRPNVYPALEAALREAFGTESDKI